MRSLGDANPARRLVMKACTGPGKSATLAWMGGTGWPASLARASTQGRGVVDHRGQPQGQPMGRAGEMAARSPF